MDIKRLRSYRFFISSVCPHASIHASDDVPPSAERRHWPLSGASRNCRPRLAFKVRRSGRSSSSFWVTSPPKRFLIHFGIERCNLPNRIFTKSVHDSFKGSFCREENPSGVCPSVSAPNLYFCAVSRISLETRMCCNCLFILFRDCLCISTYFYSLRYHVLV